MDAWLRWIPGVRGEREREEGTGGGVQKYQEEIAKLATQRNFLSLPLVAKANRKQCSDRSMNLPPWPWERRMDECMARLAPASSDPMQLLAGGAINIYISQICQWIIRLVSFSDACVVCTATLRARSIVFPSPPATGTLPIGTRTVHGVGYFATSAGLHL